MGHKVHPKIFRMSSIYTWGSKWFSKPKFYADLVKQDILIKQFVLSKIKDAGPESVEIERKGDSLNIIVNVAKPGVVIGRSGAGTEELKRKIKENFFRGKKVNFNLNIFEVKRPSLSANIVMQAMVSELEKRVPFRRVMKQAAERVMKAGAKGVKMAVAGRLNGAEIARTEKLLKGNVPLQNLRADIDYVNGTARTIYGCIGLKVWIYRGEIFEKKDEDKENINKEEEKK
ncbi:30S ribosomal protein S3 [Candidatus Parcubacteria bacterium]|nr:30S ribosomal protein S3 [Patescibacteria group bacterium]MCG2694170.1 30S ribosomal protein S3 [Candidatus Parcubacteria bacterium]